ncbi:MAG: SUMF1/EgtB/PvdO family nonheme iron enzyme [Polyangiaceae bacterium]|nr:SUMF1/EgtB/PvdO family nonheme iron enzyme [Polyangiaceae bacterium]
MAPSSSKACGLVGARIFGIAIGGAIAFVVGACSVAEEQKHEPGNMEVASASEPATATTSAVLATAEIATAAASSFTPPTLEGATTAVPSLSASSIAGLDPSASASPEGGAPPPCPADMILVNRTCVDVFEAFLEEVAADGTAKKHPYYERPVKGVTYRAANAAGDFPQGYISRVEAKAACVAAGKRLCSRAEWSKACRGKGWMTYPYGSKGQRDRCNSGKLHLLTQMFKHPAGGFKYDDHFNSPDLNKTPGFLAKAGEYSECASELGVHDMVGNLHEWVSDTVDDGFMERLETEDVVRRDQPWQVGNGVFMGGFYSTTTQHGPGCTFTTVAHEPKYHDYSTGFRCCKTADLPKPEPKKKSKSGGASKSSPATSASAQ